MSFDLWLQYNVIISLYFDIIPDWKRYFKKNYFQDKWLLRQQFTGFSLECWKGYGGNGNSGHRIQKTCDKDGVQLCSKIETESEIPFFIVLIGMVYKIYIFSSSYCGLWLFHEECNCWLWNDLFGCKCWASSLLLWHWSMQQSSKTWIWFALIDLYESYVCCCIQSILKPAAILLYCFFELIQEEFY